MSNSSNTSTPTRPHSSENSHFAEGNGHPVADKIKQTLHESVDSLSEKAAAAEDSLRKTATASSDAITEKQQQFEQKWEKSAIKRYAVENPVATAGIAFAAGALLTSLFRKK